jgi:hypothetical protein
MNDVFSAALIGALIGTFFGGFTRFLWERLVPDWMTWRRTRRLERDHQLATIRAPAYLALADLQGRLRVIAESQAHNYKYAEAIGEGDYYVRSTAYMVGRAFAWQVILRERMASYDYADLYRCLEQLTQAHSHGQPGFQIFRLDQREIGERMLTDLRAADASVLPFSEFLDRGRGRAGALAGFARRQGDGFARAPVRGAGPGGGDRRGADQDSRADRRETAVDSRRCRTPAHRRRGDPHRARG